MRDLLKSLRGFNADGRTLGLGLALAMEKQRRDTTHKVEEYLREQPVAQKASA